MEYNTQRRRLPLPEYGRSVQNMVDHALTIEDRRERQRCADTIINIMGGMFPALRDTPDFRRKLWDHLAIMSGFRLDVDYPCGVTRKDSLAHKPDPVPYTQGSVRYRHYGRILQDMAKEAAALPDEPQRKVLACQLAHYMRKSYVSWNKDGVDPRKILDDLREYSGGVISLTPDEAHLVESRQYVPFRPQDGRRPGNQHRQQAGQRRPGNQRKRF